MKEINTFSEYLADDSRVTPEERQKINFEVELIGKMIEAREKKGYSQRELAELSGSETTRNRKNRKPEIHTTA